MLKEENRELRRVASRPLITPASPDASSADEYSSSSHSDAEAAEDSVWQDTLPPSAASLPPSSAPGRTQSTSARPRAVLPLLSPSKAMSPPRGRAALPMLGARHPSPITLMEPSPAKPVSTQQLPPPPMPAVAMSPAILSAMLRSGGTLGPPALPRAAAPATASQSLRRTRTAEVGQSRLSVALAPVGTDITKDVFFDPEKRAEALRKLQEARGLAPKRGAFGGDVVIERGRHAMAATRHHMYKL